MSNSKDAVLRQQSVSGAKRMSTLGGTQSTSGQAPGPTGRPSMAGSRRGKSNAGNKRQSRATAGGDLPSDKLQIIDDDGIDRTPKPLMSLRPTVMRSALPGIADDSQTPNSDMSEFFMDRMSSTNFSRAGWYSEQGSGTQTPKSEAGDAADTSEGVQAKGQSERVTATGADERSAPGSMPGMQAVPGDVPDSTETVMLSEADLERSVALLLSETDTMFVLHIPCVTVALDTEEAKAVEAANRRYAHHLSARQTTDKYAEAEAQTLTLLAKSREVQCGAMTLQHRAAQATPWDIADTFRQEEGGGDGEEERAGTGLTSVSAMAGAVGRGEAASGPSHRATDSSGRMTVSGTRQSVFGGLMGQPSGASVHGMLGAQPSALPDPSLAALPAGPALISEGDEAGAPPDNPLVHLRGLLDALTLMDHAVTQNNYLPKLLMYRNVQALPGVYGGAARKVHDSEDGEDVESDVMSINGGRPMSAVHSDGGRSMGGRSHAESMRSHVTSRSHAAASAQAAPSMMRGRSMGAGTDGQSTMSRSMSLRQSAGNLDPGMVSARASAAPSSQRGAGGGGGMSVKDGGAERHGYAASVAESNWPEELLQELADLGDDAPRMEHLWDWTCSLTTGKHVSCMAWNKVNKDLLAVGYGTHTFSSGLEQESSGLVAFWSLKNPEHPLWSFTTKAAVTALAFSTYSPNILAVGLYDGTVAFFDVKSRQQKPSLESDVQTGKHSDPVWKLQWLDHGQERDEPLVSISTDGRVTQWSIAKGLEYTDLMKLKRMARKALPTATPGVAAAEHKDAFISRLTSGMTFDFSAKDERVYVAGTEDGWIHKCSTSYNEQYLESYSGHMGPVYQVQFSPFKRDLFVSASGDWTLRLWQEGRDNALLTFQSGSSEVNDVQWYPTNSTVFGSVTSAGRLEIWDFSLSTVKPVMHAKCGAQQSCLLFSPTCPVVVCGGEDGRVKVYRLMNVDREYDAPEEQVDRLEETLKSNAMKANPQPT